MLTLMLTLVSVLGYVLLPLWLYFDSRKWWREQRALEERIDQLYLLYADMDTSSREKALQKEIKNLQRDVIVWRDNFYSEEKWRKDLGRLVNRCEDEHGGFGIQSERT